MKRFLVILAFFGCLLFTTMFTLMFTTMFTTMFTFADKDDDLGQ